MDLTNVANEFCPGANMQGLHEVVHRVVLSKAIRKRSVTERSVFAGESKIDVIFYSF